MRPPAIVLLVVGSIILGSAIGYVWRGQEVEKLQEELSSVKSLKGQEVQTLHDELERLRALLEEAERRLGEEQAARNAPSKPMAQAGESETKARESTAQVIEKSYFLQVASLVVERNALSLKGHLEKLGYNPVIRKMTAPIVHQHVYTGEFSSREEAGRTGQRLSRDGFSATLVEGEDGIFRLEVGSYVNLNKALDMAHRLEQKEYSSKIVAETVPTSVHAVWVGPYENQSAALQEIEGLKKQGFTPLLRK